MVIIIVLKPNLKVNLGQDRGHKSGGSTRVNIQIKNFIIIVLKLDSRVSVRQGLNHGSGELTRVHPNFFKKSKQPYFDQKY